MAEAVRISEAVKISDSEQLPVPSWKRNDDQQSSIKQFTGTDMHKSGSIDMRISLIFTYILTHTDPFG